MHGMIRRPRLFLALTLVVLAVVGIGRLRAIDAVAPLRPLSQLPLVIGGWQGYSGSLAADLLARLRPDDHLVRQYRSPTGESLWLYVAYYARAGFDPGYHARANNLPGNGWEVVSADIEPVTLPDGKRAAINAVVIQKERDRQLVLYWYQDRGRVIADDAWARAWQIWDALRLRRTDGALVRINLPLTGLIEPREAGVRFAQEALTRLAQLLPGREPPAR